MHSFFQNRYIKFFGIGVAAIFALLVSYLIIINFLATSTGLEGKSVRMSDSSYAPSMSNEVGISRDNAISEFPYYPPTPEPGGYTADLEAYETSMYNITARTRQFDDVCSELTNLKTDSAIHFKYLTSSINNCRATFYADEEKVSNILTTFNSFSGVEISRTIESVTRHRAELQSQTSILEQQLASVESSLRAAEIQFDEIAEFARANKDAATLSQVISQKLNNIDMLTQRKINLTSQLDRLYQQASDLEERLGVVEFDVSVSRSYPINTELKSQKWENAWEELKDTYTDTLIGLSAFFGIFLLWAIRGAIYLLVIITILRGLWKFSQFIWKKW